jgi:hypothetical protein
MGMDLLGLLTGYLYRVVGYGSQIIGKTITIDPDFGAFLIDSLSATCRHDRQYMTGSTSRSHREIGTSQVMPTTAVL